ncbi:MAG: hypothetical protein U1E89_08260 [Burkholderiaceae bacterium]
MMQRTVAGGRSAIVWVVLAASVAQSAFVATAAAQGLPTPEAAASAAVMPPAAAPASRLKYRSKGPVCACSSDLDEAAIERALAARFGASAATPSPGSAPAPPRRAASRPPLQPQEQRR